MTRSALVTGASGFVGRALVLALAAQGFLVRAAARQPASVPQGASIEPIALPDLEDPFDWAPLIKGADVVVHLAGIASRGGVEDAVFDRIIHRATSELARACAAAGTERLIFTSAIAAQGSPNGGARVTESTEPHPVTAHDRAKLAAEAAIQAAGVPFTILRPALLYGSGVRGNVALLMRIAASPWPLPSDAFTQRRSLLALENLIGAIQFCLATPATAGQTYVVADPEPITLAEMVTILREAAGSAAQPVAPAGPFEILLRTSERNVLSERMGYDLVVDSSKLLASGWRPGVDTRSGLRAMVRTSLDLTKDDADR